MLLVDVTGTENIVHYPSNRCKLITCSLLAAELPALVLAFDHVNMLRAIVTGVLEKDMRINYYVDSKTLCDIVAKDIRTTKKQLHIDIFHCARATKNVNLHDSHGFPEFRTQPTGLKKQC